MQKIKIIRTATVAMSLDYLLKGQLAFLNTHYEVVAVSGDDDHLANVAHREGVRTVAVKMERKINPLKDVISLWKLFWLFRKEKPQIVHSITPKAGLLSMTAAYLAGVPVRIHTFTGLIFPTKAGLLQRLLIIMDQILCKCATHIYPEGQGVRKDLLDYRITNKPLKVLANGNINGVDTNYFDANAVTNSEKLSFKNKIGILKTDFVFIFVGRLVADKGINELVVAFNQYSSINSNVKLLLVGPQEPKLDPLNLDTLSIIRDNQAIVDVGFQSDVRSYYAVADALIFPSYREGFPNVVLQAGAMGLSAIVTNISGCNEIIQNGKNGIVIPIKDKKAIYMAMSKLVSDNDFQNHLRVNSRKMILSRYKQKLVWDALKNEYSQLFYGK